MDQQRDQKAFTFDKSSHKLRRLYFHHISEVVNLESPKEKNIAAALVVKHTLCTFMEGNMFWNMVAMSLICMPSCPKLLRMSSG